ncbi:MAG: hypothetical protein Q8K75_08300 [Chlamydiales bacterium]|nr:hypothetical protein [Chlamydiales bacterium]
MNVDHNYSFDALLAVANEEYRFEIQQESERIAPEMPVHFHTCVHQHTHAVFLNVSVQELASGIVLPIHKKIPRARGRVDLPQAAQYLKTAIEQNPQAPRGVVRKAFAALAGRETRQVLRYIEALRKEEWANVNIGDTTVANIVAAYDRTVPGSNKQ